MAGKWTDQLTADQAFDVATLGIDWDARCEEQLAQISKDACVVAFSGVVAKSSKRGPAERAAIVLEWETKIDGDKS